MALTGATVKRKRGPRSRPRKLAPENAPAEEESIVAASTSDQNLTDETLKKSDDGKAAPQYSPDITDFRGVTDPERTKMTPKSAKRKSVNRMTQESPATDNHPEPRTLNLESTEGEGANLASGPTGGGAAGTAGVNPSARSTPNKKVNERPITPPNSPRGLPKSPLASINLSPRPSGDPPATLPDGTPNLGSTESANQHTSETPSTNASPDIGFTQSVNKFVGTPTTGNPNRRVSGRPKRTPNSAKRKRLNPSVNTTQASPATVKSPDTLPSVTLNPGSTEEGANHDSGTTACAAVNQLAVSTPKKKVDDHPITPPNSLASLTKSSLASINLPPPPTRDPPAPTVDPPEALPGGTLNLGSGEEGANHAPGTTGGGGGAGTSSVNPSARSTPNKKVVKRRPITPPNSLGRLPKSPFASIDWSPPPPEETRIFLGQLVEFPFSIVGSPTVSSVIGELRHFLALRSRFGILNAGFADFLEYIFEACCGSYPETLRQQADHAMQQQGKHRYSDVCHFTGFARLLQMIKSSVHPSTREEEKDGLPTYVCRSFEPASTFLVQYTVHRNLIIAVFQYFRDVHQIEIPVYEGDENNFRIHSMFK